MGYRNIEDYIRAMTRGDSWLIDNSGVPLTTDLVGPFPQAFPDSIAAARAAEGLRILHQTTDFDPERNWVDFLRPRVYLNTPTGQGFTFAPDGSMYYDTAQSLSGGRSLKFFGAGPVGSPEVGSPLFRIHGGLPYRVTYVWKSSGAGFAAGLSVTLHTLTGDKATSVASYNIIPPPNGSGGTWTTSQFMAETGATEQWGYFQVVANLGGGQDTWIDSIVVEPMPITDAVNWRLECGSQLNIGAATRTVDWTTTNFSNGVTASLAANTITTQLSGYYSVGVNLELSGLADADPLFVFGQTAIAGIYFHYSINCGATRYISGSTDVYLAAGSVLSIATQASATADIGHGYFWGHRIG